MRSYTILVRVMPSESLFLSNPNLGLEGMAALSGLTLPGGLGIGSTMFPNAHIRHKQVAASSLILLNHLNSLIIL